MSIDQKIIQYIEDRLETYNDDSDRLLYNFRTEVREFYEFNSFIKKRLEDIEAMIHNHAIGVQNVYTQMQEIRDFFGIAKMDTVMLEKIARIKEIIE